MRKQQALLEFLVSHLKHVPASYSPPEGGGVDYTPSTDKLFAADKVKGHTPDPDDLDRDAVHVFPKRGRFADIKRSDIQNTRIHEFFIIEFYSPAAVDGDLDDGALAAADKNDTIHRYLQAEVLRSTGIDNSYGFNNGLKRDGDYLKHKILIQCHTEDIPNPIAPPSQEPSE